MQRLRSIRRNIKKFIDLNYSNEEVIKAAEELSKEALESKVIVKDDDIDDIKNAPVVKMIEYMFKNSIEMRASDIHIEPYEKEVRIRYRIDGELSTVNLIGIESLPPLKVVIRILDKNNYKVHKEHLGLSTENINKLNRIISNPHGIVLVTGPTGSGKSTTLYSILDDINSENINIVTVEDPVEYTLEGINPVNVNNKSGMTFASGLRSILRQDPDVIMIGEIRDDETAEIAVIFSKGMWILQ